MFTQVTIIKVGDAFKVTFFNHTSVTHAELMLEIAEVIACLKPVLEHMVEDPRSAYAKS